MKTSSDEYYQCTTCGGNIIIDTKNGYVVCTVCGEVKDDTVIDFGKEWRSYTYQEGLNRERTGAPYDETIHDKGLSTIIGARYDGYGHLIPMKKRIEMNRLRRWNNQSKMHTPKDKNLSRALRELIRITSALQLPESLIVASSKFYQKVLGDGIRGRTINGMVAAVVYIVCKKQKIPVTLDDIIEISDINPKVFTKYIRYIYSQTDTHILRKPEDFISRIASELRISRKCISVTKKIIDASNARNITDGKDPKSICGAAIYIAGKLLNEKITQLEISKAAQITETTVRLRYRELIKKLNIIF